MPSVVTDDYWIYAERKKGKYSDPTARSGKWLVFVRTEDVGGVWAKIKKAIESGSLGDQAKVATARPNPNAADAARRVIALTQQIAQCAQKTTDLGARYIRVDHLPHFQ